MLHGDVCLGIKEVLNRLIERLHDSLLCGVLKLLDGREAEFIDEVFPGSSDSLCIGVCASRFKYLLRVQASKPRPHGVECKDVLLPAVLCSVVREMVEKETDLRIPRWCTLSASSTSSLPRYHFQEDLAWVLEWGDSPKTITKDLPALRLYLHFPA